MLRRLAVAAAVSTLLAAPSVVSAQSCRAKANNLVQNCSFELGTPQRNGADYPNANVTSWTSLGNVQTGIFERWTNSFNGFAAKDGISHLELQVNSSTTIQQLLSTKAGAEYELDFWAAHRPRDLRGYSKIDVYVNNNFLMSTGEITASYKWMDFSRLFVATGTSTMLEFRSRGNQTSYGDFLDNVSVVGTGLNTVGSTNLNSSTVPEPSSLVLLGGGISLIGVMLRRRRA